MITPMFVDVVPGTANSEEHLFVHGGEGEYVILTLEEWNEIERKLDEHYEYERFELEGG